MNNDFVRCTDASVGDILRYVGSPTGSRIWTLNDRNSWTVVETMKSPYTGGTLVRVRPTSSETLSKPIFYKVENFSFVTREKASAVPQVPPLYLVLDNETGNVVAKVYKGDSIENVVESFLANHPKKTYSIFTHRNNACLGKVPVVWTTV